ncbi:hypothetical protein Vadar_031459 [Vaccinium darrowii]|uniref:Uncharacterized protein n=1 Tax=Vaccinium darrowii TaxID=229202 RepID=A0ACB7Y341_9ERIC|nr:hypothetical protein Vadar_031459 [Vaccinium darrowii]
MEMHRRDIEPDFNLKEWAVKAKMVSRENTNSRRFSGSSFKRSFREDINQSFRSNLTISSTASSPGYNTIREEIDPSTYSFTAALKGKPLVKQPEYFVQHLKEKNDVMF